MIRYVFRDKPITLKGIDLSDEPAAKIAAQKIGEALNTIRNKHQRINSKTILDEARDRNNYLHRFFEWKDSIAAEKYRQSQAREIVSCIDIVTKEKNKPQKQMPAFISLVEREGRNYRTVGEVLNSSALQAIALRQVTAEMDHLYRRVEQFAEIANALNVARELIAKRRAQFESDAGYPQHI